MQTALQRLPRMPSKRDELTERLMLAGRRRLYRLAVDDALFWYEAAKNLVRDGTTKDDGPRVALIRDMLRSFMPEQRHHDTGRTVDPAAAGALIGTLNVQINAAGDAPLERGTRQAREAAVTLEAATRAALEGADVAGAPTDLRRPPLDRPVA